MPTIVSQISYTASCHKELSQTAECLGPQWYVAQTRSRHEKRVAEQLKGKGIEHFLPLYETVSRWKDRRVRLKLPLFAGYVFARFALGDRFRTLEIPGVACLVGFGGTPAALPNADMEAMRNGLSSSLLSEPHPHLTVGRRVRITGGPFAGIDGVLKQMKNNLRVVVSLSLIQRSIVIDISAADIQVLTLQSQCQ